MTKLLAPDTRYLHWLVNMQFGVPIAIGIAPAFTLPLSVNEAPTNVSCV